MDFSSTVCLKVHGIPIWQPKFAAIRCFFISGDTLLGQADSFDFRSTYREVMTLIWKNWRHVRHEMFHFENTRHRLKVCRINNLMPSLFGYGILNNLRRRTRDRPIEIDQINYSNKLVISNKRVVHLLPNVFSGHRYL